MRDPQKILVIKLGALGDFIQALGPMAAIRKHHPTAHITLLTSKAYASFGEQCGYFDAIAIDPKPKWHQLRLWLSLKRQLNAARYSRVYDLQNNDRSNWYFKMFSPKPEWVGTAKGSSHRNAAPERTAGHAFEGHKQTLALAGIQDVEIDRLFWMDSDLGAFRDLKCPYCLLVPGCAPSRPEKRWPKEYYAELAGMLLSQGLQPVLIGAQDEAEINQFIANQNHKIYNLTGMTSLQDIAVLARNAHCAIGNDTGPIHLIAATGCPTVALFSGSSHAVKHAPQGAQVQILQQQELKDLHATAVIEAKNVLLQTVPAKT